MNNFVALSGGKDSTAMALRLREVEPQEYVYICTPTGNELPEMEAHWAKLESLLGKEIIRLKHPDYPDLITLIEEMNCLPSYKKRFCTRILKIEAAQEFYAQNQPCIAHVGLRADEERKGGHYDGFIEQRYPMREWGWTIKDVRRYLKTRGVTIPTRTDCAWCFHQQIGEWWNLYKFYPDLFEQGIQIEQKFKHTFRTPGKDGWPTSLFDMRRIFRSGKTPMKAGNLNMFGHEEICRACSL